LPLLFTADAVAAHNALQDHMSLSELDVKNNSMIAISRVLGMSVEEEGDTEKNKQFVGDLLFGHGT
jgi:hypothetical protein